MAMRCEGVEPRMEREERSTADSEDWVDTVAAVEGRPCASVVWYSVIVC
jgi:hypothetical protein